MGNTLTAKVEIVGFKPMLWHAFGPDALPLEKQERSGVPGNDPEEWRRTVLVTADGQLYVDQTYAFRCIREGSRHTKKGRGSIQPLVEATLTVLDSLILVDRFLPDWQPPLISTPIPATDPTLPVYIDIRGVVNPSTRGRNIRYRVAASSGWRMSFSLSWDKTIVSREQLHAAVIDSGKLCGMGSGRKIGFGRFDVASFDVS